MDIDRILQLLPHRYPFLMIDRIIEIDSDNSAIGIKNVTFNEPIFQGHFPGNPVFPGVLIIEGMAQTAGAIAIAADQTAGRHIVYMVTVDKCKFRKPARPGRRHRVPHQEDPAPQRHGLVRGPGDGGLDAHRRGRSRRHGDGRRRSNVEHHSPDGHRRRWRDPRRGRQDRPLLHRRRQMRRWATMSS